VVNCDVSLHRVAQTLGGLVQQPQSSSENLLDPTGGAESSRD